MISSVIYFRNVLKNFEIFLTDILHIGEALLKVDPLQPAQVVGLIHCAVSGRPLIKSTALKMLIVLSVVNIYQLSNSIG